MAEFTSVLAQTVATGQNVLLTETPVQGNKCIVHREGSGIVTLRGITNQCRAQYKVSFGANIGIATGGTLGPASVALTLAGEPLASATAIVTPAAVGDLNNVYVSVYIDVPAGCCVTVAVENTTAEAITVQNANMIVERIA